MRRFGFECELAHAAPGQFVPILKELGLRNNPDDHHVPYNHCGCTFCSFTNPGADLIRTHLDGSCAGELVSSPMAWPSPEADSVIARTAQALQHHRVQPGNTAGFHVHVEWTDLTAAQRSAVSYIFARYEDSALRPLAAGALADVRPYNMSVKEALLRHGEVGPERILSKGYMLAYREHTAEFRIWNSLADEWRMRLAVAVCVAIINAAAENKTVDDTHRLSFTDFLDPYLDAETLGLIILQTTPKEGAAA